jgi:S1-C subfamily serine protease
VRHDPKLLTRGAAVQSNVKEPLQFIKFFEINRFGLDVESGKGIARVKSVANDGAAARAGLKVGDEIVAVGSERVEPQRSLHSLLRTAYAVGHTFQVKLRRDGRDIEVTIRPPDLKK